MTTMVQVQTQSEYRDLPIDWLVVSPTNPRKTFDEDAMQELRCQHPRKRRVAAFVGSAQRGAELRDRLRRAALSCRADGRGCHRPRPHQTDDRRRGVGGAVGRIIYSRQAFSFC